MPREPRIYIEKVLYLITAKGDENTDLFNDREDYGEYLKSLAEYKKEYGFKLYAFSLLPKSLCLLIELENNVTISTIMHNLNSKYTKSYNSRYGKNGHLFQSRFKSQLIEKDDYLLRLTRYIHLLPRDLDLAGDIAKYPYSSFALYTNDRNYGELRLPDMAQEVTEILDHFQELQGIDDQHKAYTSYVNSVSEREIEDIQKLLYRKTFVGSKEFIESMRKRVQEHVQEEEHSRVIRKPNMGFITAGSMVMIFLSIVAYNFYGNQTTLQETLHKTSSGFETAREDLAKRVNNLEGKITGYEQKENHDLGGLAWELKLTPVLKDNQIESYMDQIQFKEGQVVSVALINRGFTPFDYTVEDQTHGKRIWQTVQTSPDGTTVRWYGIIAGGKMRGVFTENPVQGKSRDFSFVSVRRVEETGKEKNVIQ